MAAIAGQSSSSSWRIMSSNFLPLRTSLPLLSPSKFLLTSSRCELVSCINTPESARWYQRLVPARKLASQVCLKNTPPMHKSVSSRSIMPPSSKVCENPNGVSAVAPRIKLRDGRYLAYKEQGVPKDKAKYKVVLIHGFDSSKDIYLPLSQEFMENLSLYIVTIDRPGYGESDPNPNRTIKSDTFDVQELADKLDLGSKFYLVGVSLGNYISWGFLQYLPHRLTGAALIVPVINFWWPSFPRELADEAYQTLLTRDKIKLWIAHKAPGLVRWWMTQPLFPSCTIMNRHPVIFNAKDVDIIKKMSQVPNPNEYKIRQQGEDESLYRDMKVGFGKWEFDPMKLNNPFKGNEGSVHLWQGYEDKLVPYEMQRFIAKKLPWIKYHEVPDGGHLIIHDNVLCEEIFRTLLLS